jgi:hypothetical protein
MDGEHPPRSRPGRPDRDRRATDFPDGTVLELVPGVIVDDLADEDRDRLHEAIRRGLEQGRRGEARPIEDALADIRKPR